MKILSYESFAEWLNYKGRAGRLNIMKSGVLESDELSELRVAHKKSRLKDLNRSLSAKKSWKLNRRNHLEGIRRFHASPTGKRFHQALARFNTERRGREDYELLAPLFATYLSEHMSWLIYQDNTKLHEEVYDMMEILSFIYDCPDILEDLFSDDFMTIDGQPIAVEDDFDKSSTVTVVGSNGESTEYSNDINPEVVTELVSKDELTTDKYQELS